MPVYTPYPGPGKGISTLGLNKVSGFKQDIISQSGLNKQAGKSIAGLDTANNPIVTSTGLTAVTGTTTTITWTTQVGAPLGSVTYQKSDKSAPPVTVAETGSPPLTNHSIALTGLTAATYYDYRVTQPGAAGTGAQIAFSGRFGTTGTVTPTEMAMPDPPMAPTAEETGSAPGLVISAVEALAESPTIITVTWRTDAYADGMVSWSGGPDVLEAGNKRLNHLITLTDLTPDTDYTVTIRSMDAAGDVATSDPLTVRTPAA